MAYAKAPGPYRYDICCRRREAAEVSTPGEKTRSPPYSLHCLESLPQKNERQTLKEGPTATSKVEMEWAQNGRVSASNRENEHLRRVAERTGSVPKLMFIMSKCCEGQI